MAHKIRSLRYKPLISIIVPIYNAELYLERCLRSLEKQTYQNTEIVLIDDGSEDGSREICQRYVKKDARFSLYIQNNRGVSEARNLGLDKVSGEYILFTDSDDYLEENYVMAFWKTMELTKADMVVCNYRQECRLRGDSDMKHYTAPPGNYRRKAYIDRVSRCPGAHYFGVLWNKIYRTELLRNNGMRFDPKLSLGEDFVFNMEYLSLIKRIYVIADKLYIYSWENADSLSHYQKTPEKRIEERITLYHAYIALFQREHLGGYWNYRLHYYILKAYFEEIKALEEEDEREKAKFYQAYVRNSGIGKTEFWIFCLLRRWKQILKI